MTREEVFKFIKQYDLFPSVNFEEGFEDFVYPTSKEDDARIKDLTDAFEGIDEAGRLVTKQLDRWKGPFADDAVELDSEMIRAVDRVFEVIASVLEEIIEVDWDSYKQAKDGSEEISRDEYLADEYEDEIRLAFKDRNNNEEE